MARSSYQYETSPRKIQPEYNPKRETTKSTRKPNNEKLRKEKEKQRKIELKKEKRKHHKNIALIISVFLVLLAVSYRNSLITEQFNEIQDKKAQLAAIEKTNGQLEVDIEESINLNNVEKEAEKDLGMQKLSNDQKVYVNLNKKDYTESGTTEITADNNSNWFENLINNIFNF